MTDSDINNKAQLVAEAIASVYENKQVNKKNNISGDFSDDNVSYPTVKAVKTELAKKQDISSAFSGSYNDLTNKPDLNQYIDETELNTALSSYTTSTALNNLLSGKSDTGHTHTKSEITDFPTNVSEFTNDVGYLTSHQSLTSKDVTVEKLTTAETGYIASYVVKQNNSQVGATINIPKDYLVKSATVEECSVADEPVTGYKVGDTYIDFIINTKDGSGNNEHLYLLVNDLVDVYSADNTTLEVNNNTFKVKNKGITSTQLSDAVNTSLGYANDWNNSVAKSITQADINGWNGKSSIGIDDVDARISLFAEALASAINPNSS